MTKFPQEQFESIRREYGKTGLAEDTMCTNPIDQFHAWFIEAKQTEPHDPTAMVLSTVDADGVPDSRVVLLKGLNETGFVFYTHYQSAKAVQLKKNPYAALNFYWPQLARQVRIRGLISKTSRRQSDEYFSSRPFLSQVAAMTAIQSTEIPDRTSLEEAFQQRLALSEHEKLIRSEHWGGYRLMPDAVEFWQGRDNRLHDRIVYTRKNQSWQKSRLAP